MASRAKGIFSAKSTKDAEYLTELRLNRASDILGYTTENTEQDVPTRRYKRFNPFERQ